MNLPFIIVWYGSGTYLALSTMVCGFGRAVCRIRRGGCSILADALERLILCLDLSARLNHAVSDAGVGTRSVRIDDSRFRLLPGFSFLTILGEG